MDIMIDIETLATTPDAVVLSIGAVEFDPLSGETGKTFYRNLLQVDQYCRNVDKDTLKWWEKQSSKARAALMRPAPSNCREALRDLKEFCKDATRLWANSPQFDLTILANLGDEMGVQDMWPYWKATDFRTLKALAQLSGRSVAKPKVSHHALEDCFSQITQVVVLLSVLGLTPPDTDTVDSSKD